LGAAAAGTALRLASTAMLRIERTFMSILLGNQDFRPQVAAECVSLLLTAEGQAKLFRARNSSLSMTQYGTGRMSAFHPMQTFAVHRIVGAWEWAEQRLRFC